MKKPGVIAHARVSSPKQAQQGDSLDLQEKQFRDIASTKGWDILPNGKVWREGFSGRKEVRLAWNEIIDHLKKNPGEVQYYLFKSIDRFTRGGTLPYLMMQKELAKYGVQMVDVNGLIQPAKNTLEDLGFEYEWSEKSNSKIAEIVMASVKNDEVTDILTRTIGQQIRLTQKGYKVRSPQDGYKNEVVYHDNKKRVVMVPDSERAEYHREMFKLRADGQLSDPEIVDRINAMGYRTRIQNYWDKDYEKVIGHRGNIPLSVKHLQAIIKRPIYCGVVVEKWTRGLPVKAPYDGLISIDTWNRANRGDIFIKENENGSLELLYDVNRKEIRRDKNNPLFPYKNVVLCAECNKPFIGSASRGKSGKKFPAYHCARGHKRVSHKKSEFEKSLETMIQELKFKPAAVRKGMRTLFLDKYRDRQSEIMQSAASIGRTVADLEVEKAMALKAFISTTSIAVREAVEKQIDTLDQQIKATQTERNKLEVTESDIDQFIKAVEYVMEHPSELLLNPVNTTQQQSLYSLFFDGLPTYPEIASGTPKLDWVFKLNLESSNEESDLGCLQGFEP
jgi:hypothetical protein